MLRVRIYYFKIGELNMLPAKRLNGQNWLPDIFNDFFEGNSLSRINGSAPAMNVFEDEKSYSLEIAAPGMCKKDFQVHISKDGNLVVEMERKCEDKQECKREGKYLRKEFSYTKFHQTLILPENADKDNIEANVKDGVLYVTIPKLQMAKTEAEKKVIEVK
jgi:HSP20 family protein